MKKIVLLFLLLIPLLISCTEQTTHDMKGITNLIGQEIFTQEEERYYIFFYRDNCADCERVKPYVLDYIELAKSDDQKIPIYGVNLSQPDNQRMYRGYTGSAGQGTGDVCSGKFRINGVTKADDLYVGCTSSLILIYTSNGVHTALFRANGADNIRENLGV